MSNTDSFIDEVTDEVRRDRLFAFFRRYGWIAILAVVMIVAGAAFVEWRKAREAAASERFGDAVMAALLIEEDAARLAALNGIEADGNRAAVLRFMLAANAVQQGDRDSALAAFAELAADAGLPESYWELAALKRVLLAGPAMDAAERAAALEALARPGQPFRILAMEQQAVGQMETGDTAGAIATLQQVLQEPDLTGPLRRRTGDLLVALGARPEAQPGPVAGDQ